MTDFARKLSTPRQGTSGSAHSIPRETEFRGGIVSASSSGSPRIAQAAAKQGAEPRSISFKGAAQTLEAFQSVLALRGRDPAADIVLYQRLLEAVASHCVGNRPDRVEPRRRKRRPKPYDRLMKPRCEAKRVLLKGVREK